MGDAPTSFPNYIGLHLSISSSARTNPASRKAFRLELSRASPLRIFGAALLQQNLDSHDPGRDSSSLSDLVLSFAIILQLSSSVAYGLVLNFLKFSSSYYVEFTCHTTV
jgi:hypothetical protein